MDIFLSRHWLSQSSKISAINKLRGAAISQELEAGTERASFERHLAERYIVNSVIRTYDTVLSIFNGLYLNMAERDPSF